MWKPLTFSLACLALAAAGAAAPSASPQLPPPAHPMAYRGSARLPDVAELPEPADVQLSGYLGRRVVNSERNRLLKVEEGPLLAGFRKRPGEQAWIGEHIGKWLHAATLAWVNTGDPELRAKLDRFAADLIATQEPDGYLGTYVPDKRFGLYRNADWDVWVHKYDLIGLLTYYHYTGNDAALNACRKVGDLLIATFGQGKKSIISAGTHVGMAATSVLEPMVLLYRTTGDPRYLDFAKYLVSAWDEPNGPHLLHTLLTEKSVAKTANGKAYEMLSNLVGLCELARATGDPQYLQAARNAWEDVVAHQLYVTGTASHFEHFHDPYDLPNQQKADVGETCVTVTWIQLNAQLLRLTGEAKYGDELERSYYNHLAAAQRPDGAEWCYYTSLEGTKPYGPGINCCVSSGPRGMALAPQLAYLKGREAGKDTLLVNLYESGNSGLELGGRKVDVEQTSDFLMPAPGSKGLQAHVTLTFHLPTAATFGLKLRTPAWSGGLHVRGAGRVSAAGGWTVIAPRRWKDGGRVEVEFETPFRLVAGDHGNAGKEAILWGPVALAYDEKRNPGLPVIGELALAAAPGEVKLHPTAADPLAFMVPVRGTVLGRQYPAIFVPFAEAGTGGGKYEVWLPAADKKAAAAVPAGAARPSAE